MATERPKFDLEVGFYRGWKAAEETVIKFLRDKYEEQYQINARNGRYSDLPFDDWEDAADALERGDHRSE